MPYQSDRQRRYIHAQADRGVTWAKRFVAHSHGKAIATASRRGRRLKRRAKT